MRIEGRRSVAMRGWTGPIAPSGAIEQVFAFAHGRVSNVCSVTEEEIHMKLALEIALIAYVLYAVLGAPLVASARDSGRSLTR